MILLILVTRLETSNESGLYQSIYSTLKFAYDIGYECLDLNSQLVTYESIHITTRPGLTITFRQLYF